MKRLWSDESGAVLSLELILILVIVVLGVGVGLVALRDAVDAKLCDLANAIAQLDVNYSYVGLSYTSPIDNADISSTATTVVSTSTTLDFAPATVLKSTAAP